MYNAFRSLGGFKLLTLLVIIQLALGISLLDNVAMQLMGVINKRDVYTEMFDVNNTYMIRVRNAVSWGGNNSAELLDEGTEELASEKAEELTKEICKDIYDLKDKRIIKYVFSCYNYSGVIADLYDKSPLEQSKKDMGPNSYLVTLQIDKNFYEHYELKIEEGRTFSEEDFNLDYRKDIIPIVVGNDYKDIVNVGDVLLQEWQSYEGDTVKIKYKVIGFLETNSIVSFLARNELFNAITYTNSIVIQPAIDTFPVSMAMQDIGIFLETGYGNDITKVQEEINDVIRKYDPDNKYGFYLHTVSLREDMGAIKASLVNDINIAILLGGVLILLAIIGITTAILGELKQRRKEFGIRMACGASIKDISKEIIIKVLILSFISAILGFLYVGYTVGEYTLGLGITLLNISLVAFFTIAISVVPVISLKKYDVVKLLREDIK